MANAREKEMRVFFNSLKVLWGTSRIYFIATFLLSITSAAPSILNLLIWKRVLDDISRYFYGERPDYRTILLLIAALLAINIAADAMSKLSSYIREIYSLMIEKQITHNVIDAASRMDLDEVEDEGFHDLIEKSMFESCDKLIALLGKLVEFVQSVGVFIGMTGIMLSFSIGIYVIIFLSVLPMALYSSKYFNKIYSVYNERVEKIRFSKELKNMAVRPDVFKEIRVFGIMPLFKGKIDDILDEMIREDKSVKGKLNREGVAFQTVQTVFVYLMKAVIIVRGIFGRQSIGTINMNMDSATQLQNSISNIIFIGLSLYDDCLYLSSYDAIIKRSKAGREGRGGQGRRIRDFEIDTVEFVHVWFRYKADGGYALRDVNLKFSAGRTYALVGYNGSGKSTLVKLLLGLYRPTRGAVLVNGVDIGEYDIEEYWRKASAVFQDYARYPFTVAENIGVGDMGNLHDADRIREAAREARAEEFIENLPNRYGQRLVRGWKDSTDLSIGQWQRLAIARGYIRRARLLVLDEPASALDARTEREILKGLVENRGGGIVVFISHRFLNIKKFDEIVVLNSGEIDGTGTHERLMDECETYRVLYESQKEMTG